jgi:hypothetical protein
MCTHINAAAKQFYFTVLYSKNFVTVLKSNINYTFSRSGLPKKNGQFWVCASETVKKHFPVYVCHISITPLNLWFVTEFKTHSYSDPVPYYSVTTVHVQCTFHLAEQQIIGIVYKPEMAKICTRTIHIHFAWPNVFQQNQYSINKICLEKVFENIKKTPPNYTYYCINDKRLHTFMVIVPHGSPSSCRRVFTQYFIPW